MGRQHLLIMKKILLQPLFIFGLALRLGFIFLISPTPVIEWYTPFLNTSLSTITMDPWGVWLSQNGSINAFPYGYAMWLFFLPLVIIFKAISFTLIYSYGLTLLLADLALLILLQHIIKGSMRLLLLCYWLSPIVIVATYILGLNDVVPMLFLVLAIAFIRNANYSLSGFFCIVAISAKLSMVIALPFFFIYLAHNRSLRQFHTRFIGGVAIGLAVLIFPFLFSHSGMEMLFSNPEMKKVYLFSLGLGGGIQIYLVPLVYVLTLYAAWRVRRLNFDLFQAMMGVAFMLVVLLSSASPGWFVWVMPLLVIYQLSSDKVGVILTGIFSCLYAINNIAPIFSKEIPLFLGDGLYKIYDEHGFSSLFHTGMVALGLILLVRIWRESIVRNDYFRLSRRPFVIGIAGDSGAGKDTFSNAMGALFGGHSVTMHSGDDYHLWDRQKPMWQVMTHLNPMANDLEAFANDLVALTDGKSISMRHYDHQTGRMGQPTNISSNDFIIASGLHALYLPILRDCYNLSVYLDIDESLRRHFKIQRDVGKRGHTLEKVLASFERREADSARFIKTQAIYADLVFSVQPIHPRMLQDNSASGLLRYKLVVRSRHGLNELSLTRILVGICGLHVDVGVNNDAAEVQLTIEGDASAQDVALAAKMICPRIFEFLDIEPKWQDGVLGLMQLITLSHINQALTKRFI